MIRVDDANIGYKMNDNNLVRILELIRGEMVIGKNILIPIKKAQIRDNPQACVLCNIIKTWLLFNYLQRMFVKEIFHHAITIRENQCSNRNQ